MKKIVAFFASVVAVAALAAFITLRWTESRATRNVVAAHEWLHRELQLTESQHQALEPVEAKFAEKERRLVEQLRAANLKLARVMTEEKAYTPRVAAEVEMVHQCMGDLQKASIEHVFEMRAVLTPEQGDKLLGLAQRALEHAP
jgi:Spy/CpxP family protein refolding chaperone